jgi:dihydroorotate dehydrogenase (fumarate)
MIDLTTTYLGLELRSPLVASASPLTEEADSVKRLEDAGAAAVVLPSLFEEQLAIESLELHHHMTHGTYSYAEALTYFPEPDVLHLGPEKYLERIQRAKAAVSIPVIASLNGSTIGGWTKFAKKMQEAGADAIELNVYSIPTDMDMVGAQVEQSVLDILSAVKSAVTLPVAIKLSPYFSNMANMAKRLDEAGADGLVLFNRFYQPDIDLETLEVKPNLILSTPHAQRLPMRWIAILYGRVKASLAATSGIHTAEDVVKMILVGASVTMMAAALLKHGINHLREVETGVRRWMEEHEYESVTQMRGAVSQINCEDPSAFERAQYMKALTHYTPEK